jgi:hypothetical protein
MLLRNAILLAAVGVSSSCTQRTERLTSVYLFNSCASPIAIATKNASNYPSDVLEATAPPDSSVLIAIYASADTDLDVLIEDDYLLSVTGPGSRTATVTGPELRRRIRDNGNRDWWPPFQDPTITVPSTDLCQ